MMKRASDNLQTGYSSITNSQTMDVNNKKAKIEGSPVKSSCVVHIRGVPSDVTEPEIIQIGMPFGKMSNLVIARRRNQALLEMADLESAQSMVNFYSEKPPHIRDRVVYVQFSTYEHLKTENSNVKDLISNAEQLVSSLDESKTVLRVIVDNMIYPITLDILKLIFSKFGQVLRIVTYKKNNTFQAFIEYSDALSAKTGMNALNNQNIYNGCCNLRIDYSHLDTLQVKYNSDKTYDYTNPNLPSGQIDVKRQVDGRGDGLLGSYNGSLNNPLDVFGLGGLSKLGLDNVGMGMNNSSRRSGDRGNNYSSNGNMHPSLLDGLDGVGMGSFNSLGGMFGGMGASNMLGSGPGLGMGNNVGSMGGNSKNHMVLIVSNLNEEKITPDYLFTLFGMYGMVVRVKIMYNKKDSALIQFADPILAQNAITCLDKVRWWGKTLKVSMSKHNFIQMPKEEQMEMELTKDYTNSKLHRHNNPNSKNYGSINPPSGVLHLANIPDSIKEDDLAVLFSKFGTVMAIKFLETEKKMALLQFETVEEAVGALVEMNNYQFPGPLYLRVSFTKSVIS